MHTSEENFTPYHRSCFLNHLTKIDSFMSSPYGFFRSSSKMALVEIAETTDLKSSRT